MQTYSAKPAEVEKKWLVIDADGVVLGRLASTVAKLLRGKHKTIFTPHIDTGDHVVIINAEKVKLTGRKFKNKIYYRHTGFAGGIKTATPEFIMAGKYPERIIEKAVERMMPKESPLARQQLTKLRVYAGAEHPHTAQKAEVFNFAAMNPKNKEVEAVAKAKTTSNTVKAAKAETVTVKATKEKATSGPKELTTYGTGRRKNAIARVWVKRGNGKITVNGKSFEHYFARPVLRMIINQPFASIDRIGNFDITCTVTGGGLSGQAGAVRLGISRALDDYDTIFHKPLRSGGFLTRDSRVVERKKYGHKKARRSFQFSKR